MLFRSVVAVRMTPMCLVQIIVHSSSGVPQLHVVFGVRRRDLQKIDVEPGEAEIIDLLANVNSRAFKAG